MCRALLEELATSEILEAVDSPLAFLLGVGNGLRPRGRHCHESRTDGMRLLVVDTDTVGRSPSLLAAVLGSALKGSVGHYSPKKYLVSVKMDELFPTRGTNTDSLSS